MAEVRKSFKHYL